MKRHLLSWLAVGIMALPLLNLLVAPAALANHHGQWGGGNRGCQNGQGYYQNNQGQSFNGNRGWSNTFNNNNGYQRSNWQNNNGYQGGGYQQVNYNPNGGNGRYYGGTSYNNGRPFFQTKAGRITKGGLIGGGVGAATGVLTNRDVLKTGLVGAGVGAGIQAIRYW